MAKLAFVTLPISFSLFNSIIAQEYRSLISLEGGAIWASFSGSSDNSATINGVFNHGIYRYYDRDLNVIGPSLGIGYELMINKRFSLKTRLVWNSKSGYADNVYYPSETNNSIGIKEKTTLDYLNIPFLARFGFGEKFRVFIQAGPYIGFLLKSKTGNGEHEVDYKLFDNGLEAGAGIQLNYFKKITIEIGTQYSNGLREITSSTGAPLQISSIAANIGVGYRFGSVKNK